MAEGFPYEKVQRTVMVRMKAVTNPAYGCNPLARPVRALIEYGIVNIDKPSGPTSHQVSAFVRDIMQIDKAGHSGTLDPHVTGVLPVAFGRATRAVELLLKAGKEYVALMHVHWLLDEQRIRDVCAGVTGSIDQLPPIRSAVKRQLRVRNVYYLTILEIDGQDVLFRVGCEAGTYIRKLIHDMGRGFGCGAHMVELRRTRAGGFGEDTLVQLGDLRDAMHYYQQEGNELLLRHCIQPIENAVVHVPKVWVLDTAVDSLCHGASLHNPGIAKVESGIGPHDLVAVMTLKDELVCYGASAAYSQGMLAEKGLAVNTDKVFMLPGTYPVVKKPGMHESG